MGFGLVHQGSSLFAGTGDERLHLRLSGLGRPDQVDGVLAGPPEDGDCLGVGVGLHCDGSLLCQLQDPRHPVAQRLHGPGRGVTQLLIELRQAVAQHHYLLPELGVLTFRCLHTQRGVAQPLTQGVHVLIDLDTVVASYRHREFRCQLGGHRVVLRRHFTTPQ